MIDTEVERAFAKETAHVERMLTLRWSRERGAFERTCAGKVLPPVRKQYTIAGRLVLLREDRP